MLDGIQAALPVVRDEAQRQILLITDGLIGFEARVIAEVLANLPRGSRLHTLGVGSAVNRSLTAPLARAGRGSEHVIGLGEDVEPVLQRVLAKLEAPLLSDLAVSGSAVVACGRSRLSDLHAGSSVQIPFECAADGGHVVVEGTTADGRWRSELELPAPAAGAARSPLAALFARERVEDLEMRRAAGEPGETLDAEIERLGLTFSLSSRLTSWVARSEKAMVDPTLPTRDVEQPQLLPHGMSVAALGLRPALAAGFGEQAYDFHGAMAAAPRSVGAASSRVVMRRQAAEETPAAPPRPAPTPRDPTRLPVERTPPAELHCKVALLDANKLVISVTFSEFASWRLPKSVRVRLSSGREVELAVEPAHSTATTELRPGQTARLWLLLGSALENQPAAFQLDREWLPLATGG
jgi:Ca-activated chloride channel family protein